jgi:hypothetical protein
MTTNMTVTHATVKHFTQIVEGDGQLFFLLLTYLMNNKNQLLWNSHT